MFTDAIFEALAAAQLSAIRKLASLLENCDNPAEIRRIASALLRFKLQAPAAQPTPAVPETPQIAAPKQAHHLSAPTPCDLDAHISQTTNRVGSRPHTRGRSSLTLQTRAGLPCSLRSESPGLPIRGDPLSISA